MLPRRARRLRLRAIPRRTPWGPIKAIGAAALLLLGLFWVTRYHAAGSGVHHTATTTCAAGWRPLAPGDQTHLVCPARATTTSSAPTPSTPYTPPPTPVTSVPCQHVLAGGQAEAAGHPLGQRIYTLCAANHAYTYTHADLLVAHCLTTNGVAADAAWTDATTPGLQGSLLDSCRAHPNYNQAIGCPTIIGHVTGGRVNPTAGLPLAQGGVRWVPSIVDTGAPLTWIKDTVMGGVSYHPLGPLGSLLFPFFHNMGGRYLSQTVVVGMVLRGPEGQWLQVGAHIHAEMLKGAPAGMPTLGLGLNFLRRAPMSVMGNTWTMQPNCA